MTFFQRLKDRARRLKAETMALYLAVRDPRTPWYAKLLGAAIVAYAFSPIDLIPDFVPIIGYLDDLVLIPAGIALVIKMLPPSVLVECRERVQDKASGGMPKGRAAAAVIIGIWIAAALLCVGWAYRTFR